MGTRAQRGALAPGGVVGDGRYRLLAQFGIDERAGAHLWRARDGQLRRDVALTMLVGDPADPEAALLGRRTLERAAHAATFEHPGVARVLDVLSLGSGISSSEGLLGIVVAEWTKGTDLIDLVAERPVEPGAAARMVRALAESVDQAHQSGLVLGIDHPQRLRLTPDGRLRLAFPGPLPDATLRDDVKALGSVLYLLLTGRWALPGGPPALAPAPKSPTGRIVPAKSLQPRVPQELSALSVRTIEDGDHGGIRTSAAILRALDHAAEAAERAKQPAQPAESDGTVWTTKKPTTDKARRRKLALGVTVLVCAAVGVLAWLGMMAISFFQDDADTGGPDVNLADPTPTQQEGQPGGGGNGADGADGAGQQAGPPVAPSSIDVYSPEGSPDSPGTAPLAIDGDPTTIWRTDTYQQQLPALKTGVGLVATFDEPVDLSAVRVIGDSPGTEVEVRTASAPDVPLDATQVVGEATMGEVVNEVQLDQPPQTQYVIVWISRLGGEEPEFYSEFGELRFLSAG
ncbi:hypothetical protein BJF85_05940 [Saccharomonospora sp. CUA-673]|uniref:protein kinase family protein n=1 Tax=Saccharomonospora sp. CUA-673 TaxID=1904969 RepID=UPI000964990B|nr:protein kinase family protein [Saccharomonospora sp. CUA-673]OLT40666.1 hypothetical protein BJF85_05940 [Saccharomonospora sp. CUA-673]